MSTATDIEWEVLGAYTIPGEPRPKGRPQFVRGRAITPAHTREETKRVREYLQWTGPAEPFAGDLAVILRYRRTNRTVVDIDNLVKLTLDAANGVLWADDAQITRLDAEKILNVIDAVVRRDVYGLLLHAKPGASFGETPGSTLTLAYQPRWRGGQTTTASQKWAPMNPFARTTSDRPHSPHARTF